MSLHSVTTLLSNLDITDSTFCADMRGKSQFELDLVHFFNSYISSSSQPIRITLYTDEFDLNMFALFFPNIQIFFPQKSALNQLKTHVGTIGFFNNFIDPKVQFDHPISIIRNNTQDLGSFSLFTEKIETRGIFTFLYLKEEDISERTPLVHSMENKEVIVPYTPYFFPIKKGLDLSKLHMTEVGLYSATPWKWNFEISIRIKNIIVNPQNHRVVLDANGCVGGDTIGFARNFREVISIEKDHINFNALENNVRAYDLKNVVLYNQDFLKVGRDLINRHHVNILYFDPPWNNRDYKEQDKIDLYLNDHNIKDIIKEITALENSELQLIVLKAPKILILTIFLHPTDMKFYI